MSKIFQTVCLTVEVYVSLNTTQDLPAFDKAKTLSREIGNAVQKALSEARVTNSGVTVKSAQVEGD